MLKTEKEYLKKIKAIIWDWNGTLLNDLDMSILSMNQMLERRKYPQLTTEKYKEIFTFPVRDYYIKAGVNFTQDQWDEVAMEFINNYRTNVTHTEIHFRATETLNYLNHKNYRQYILSAMQQNFLNETVSEKLGDNIFEEVVGLNNHYAHTKIETARLLVEKINIPKSEIVMIGDTIHDYEVTEAAGINCILFSGGHQSRQRLEQTGALIIDNLQELEGLL